MCHRITHNNPNPTVTQASLAHNSVVCRSLGTRVVIWTSKLHTDDTCSGLFKMHKKSGNSYFHKPIWIPNNSAPIFFPTQKIPLFSPKEELSRVKKWQEGNCPRRGKRQKGYSLGLLKWREENCPNTLLY